MKCLILYIAVHKLNNTHSISQWNYKFHLFKYLDNKEDNHQGSMQLCIKTEKLKQVIELLNFDTGRGKINTGYFALNNWTIIKQTADIHPKIFKNRFY